MKKSIKHTRFYSERYGFGVRVHILLAQVPDAVYSLSSLVSQRTIQMTDSIKNPSIDFRILLLSQLPLPAPAQSILQRDYIDSGKGDVIQWSMSASAVWRWESWRLLLLKGDICVCLHVNSGHQGCSLYGFLWLCIVCEACVRGWHAWPQGAEGQTLIISTMEPLVCLHWSEEGFYGGAIGRERGWGRYQYQWWLVGGSLPASLMIKGGCDTLTQAKNPPWGALLLIQPAVATTLISQTSMKPWLKS